MPAGPVLRLSHFGSMTLFALFLSFVFAGVAPGRTPVERVKYAARTFVLFLVVAIVLAWLIYPLSR